MDEPVFVLLAKTPTPGNVKSRLIGRGIESWQAAAIALAMLRCTAARLRPLTSRLVLAIDDLGAASHLQVECGSSFDGVVEQGGGSLGDRLCRVWRQVDASAPAAFFGGDAPDVPHEVLASIADGLRRNDVAIGPAIDGGYWTVAARSLEPGLFSGIDWGGQNVYDQTTRAARRAGLKVARLAEWMDVDTAVDLEHLRDRLSRTVSSERPPESTQPLLRLLDDLNLILTTGDRSRAS